MYKINPQNQNKIDSLKREFEETREQIKYKFYDSKNALNTCSQNSKNADQFIKKLFDLYSFSYSEVSENVCICALGGYGRI